MTVLKTLRAYLVFVTLIIIAALLWYVSNHHSVTPPVKKSPAQVTVASLTYRELPQMVSSYATAVSPESVSIVAQTDGVIHARVFQFGQWVDKGDLLFRLQPADANLQTAKLKAALNASQSYYQRLQAEYARSQAGISRNQLMQARDHYRQDLTAYQQALTVNNIKATTTGRIADSDYAVGDYVAKGTVLTQIVKPESIQVSYQLPSRYLSQLHLGQSIQFMPNNSRKVMKGRVVYIAPMLSLPDYSVTLRASVHKPLDVPLHSFGRILQVLNANHKALALPQTVVQTDAKGFYIFTVDDNKVAKRYFTPGLVNASGYMVVQKGLMVNMRYITSNLNALSVGESVQVKSS